MNSFSSHRLYSIVMDKLKLSMLINGSNVLICIIMFDKNVM